MSAAVAIAVLYGPYNGQSGKHTVTVAEGALYNGWSRTAWCLAIGYVVLACHTGNGGELCFKPQSLVDSLGWSHVLRTREKQLRISCRITSLS